MFIDHLGNEFKSRKELCDYYNIPEYLYKNRKRAGWTMEEILTTPTRNNNKTITDHLGNKFNTIKALCDFYDISLTTYYKYVKQGLSFEEILKKKDSIITSNLHVGESFKQSNNYTATIIQKTGADEYTVQFNDKDKTIRASMCYSNIKQGRISLIPKKQCPLSVGDTKVMNNGLKITIQTIRNSHDIDILWENGVVSEHKYSADILSGKISCPDYTGIERMQKCGLSCKIIECKKDKKYGSILTLEWEDGSISTDKWGQFNAQRCIHPELTKYNAKRNFHNYRATYLCKNFESRLYKCECVKCGYKAIMTASQMSKEQHNCIDN